METEMQFGTIDWSIIENINSTIAKFNKILQDAAKKFTPKGHRKNYNPNFTPEIELIRQRNNLKYHTALPYTVEITERTQRGNQRKAPH